VEAEKGKGFGLGFCLGSKQPADAHTSNARPLKINVLQHAASSFEIRDLLQCVQGGIAMHAVLMSGLQCGAHL
jgi:hypothetical protein